MFMNDGKEYKFNVHSEQLLGIILMDGYEKSAYIALFEK
jgi:hypothetical protein